MGHVRRRRFWIAALTACLLVSITGVAAAQSGWLSSSHTEQPRDRVVAQVEPIETRGSEIASSLSAAVAGLPGFPTDLETADSVEFSTETERLVVVNFVAPDGALLDVVMQRLPHPLPLPAVDPSGESVLSRGSNGEDIVVVDMGHTLQVIAIGSTGVMANVIVQRLLGVAPETHSSLSSLTSATVIDWALVLLERVGEDL